MRKPYLWEQKQIPFFPNIDKYCFFIFFVHFSVLVFQLFLTPHTLDPVILVPSMYFIDQQGSPVEVIGGHIGLEQLRDRILKLISKPEEVSII